MAQITDKIRQRFKFLKLAQDINNPALALNIATKTTVLAAITAAESKVSEVTPDA